MSKWPSWLRWVYVLAVVGGIVALLVANIMTNAYNTPAIKLPAIYWLVVTAFVVVYVPLVVLSYVEPIAINQVRPIEWMSLASYIILGIASLFTGLVQAVSPPVEGSAVSSGVSGIFILLMAGSTLRNLRRAERH